MSGIVELASAISGGLKIVKDLSDVNREWDKAELRLKVAELAGALATAKMALAETQEDVQTKDAEIGRLRASFQTKEQLVEYHGYHYRPGSDGGPQGRPYCPVCMQEGRLFMTGVTDLAGRPVRCPSCKSNYYDAAEFAFE